MAENKPTHQQHGHTRELADFPEVRGKVVNNVELFSDSECYAITIKFEDRTSLHFAIQSAVFTFPVLSDWTGGNEKILWQYKAVRSKVQR